MSDWKRKLGELAARVGKDRINVEPEVTAAHAVDNRVPGAVVFPGNTEQVSAVVRFADRENLAVVPWGSGSKMGMGNPPERLDLVVCTSRMNHMVDVDTANLTMTVEAGVRFRDIQARLATREDRCYLPLDDLAAEADDVICSDRSHSGCFLPMDPSHAGRATIGGIVATNSSGPRRLLYRLPRDCILGVRLVSPGGDIIGSGGKTVKNVSGYDISRLMVGSLGSLGMICEMTFRLLPLPERMETLLISFESFAGAAAFAERLLNTSLLPAAVEVMNSRAYGRLERDGLHPWGPGGYVAAIALEGFEQAVERMKSEALDMARANGARSNAHLEEDEHRSFWLAVSDPGPDRDKGSAVIRAKLNYPISEWQGIVQSAERIYTQAGLDCSIQAHAGSGICLNQLVVDLNDASAKDRAATALDRLLGRCREVDGNLVILSAPAELKGKLKVWGEAGSHFVVMKRIKDRLDPSRIMSPGRFVGGL